MMDVVMHKDDVPSWSCLQETQRSNWHTSAACLCGQALVILGGTGRDDPAEVYVYHLHELKWLQGQPTGEGPPMRPLYCAATGRGDTVAVVWSKLGARGQVQVTLSVLCLAEMEWQSLPLDARRCAPPRRGYSALMTAGRDVVVFGGESGAGHPTPSAACIVVNPDNTAAPLPPEECPPPRSDHASCLAPHDTIVIHGGRGGAGRLLGDMHVYDGARRTWVGVGDGPARCGHSIAATESMILLFGGVDAAGAVLNDLWAWAVPTRQWSGPLLAVGAAVPRPRAGHLLSLVWPVLDGEGGGGGGAAAAACFILYGGVEGPGEPPYHDIHRLTVPADKRLPLAVPLSQKLRPVENPIEAHGMRGGARDDGARAGEGYREVRARLRGAEAALAAKEQELDDVDHTLRARAAQIQQEKAALRREHAALAREAQRFEEEAGAAPALVGAESPAPDTSPGAVSVHPSEPPPREHQQHVAALERQLQEERVKVSMLMARLPPPAAAPRPFAPQLPPPTPAAPLPMPATLVSPSRSKTASPAAYLAPRPDPSSPFRSAAPLPLPLPRRTTPAYPQYGAASGAIGLPPPAHSPYPSTLPPPAATQPSIGGGCIFQH